MFEWLKKLFKTKETEKEIKIVETHLPIQTIKDSVIMTEYDVHNILGENNAKEIMYNRLKEHFANYLPCMISYYYEHDRIGGKYILHGEINFVKR